jgi:hypothetical protein
MDAEMLFAHLRERGFRLAADGTSLLVEAGDRLTEAECEAIRQHKSELLRLLSDLYNCACAIARHCERNGEDLKDYLERYAPELLMNPTGPLKAA